MVKSAYEECVGNSFLKASLENSQNWKPRACCDGSGGVVVMAAVVLL